MNNKIQYCLNSLIFVLGAILIFTFLSEVNAANLDIIFPVQELGNCENQKDCRVFCDKSENIEVCVSFAEKHNLISGEEAKKAKAFINSGKRGPGGCDGKDACEKYCDDSNNIEECVNFAEKNSLMSGNELKEAKKVKEALKKGAKLPGGCKNKKECDAYCENPDNIEACLSFAETAGFIEKKELEEARKFAPLMKKGETPGGCKNKKECEKYCADDKNFEECVSFAEKIGFMSKKEVEMAKKTGGKGPGGCKGKEECDRFCEDESNLEVCLSFAEKHGMISKEDVEMAKKTGGKGPGGCKGKDECEEFCSDPENEEVCFNFGKERGLIPQEDLEMMEEGANEMKEMFEDAPEEVIECLNSSLGFSSVQKMREGKMMPRRDTGDKIRECFEETTMNEMMGEEEELEDDDFNDEFRNENFEDNFESYKNNREDNPPFSSPRNFAPGNDDLQEKEDSSVIDTGKMGPKNMMPGTQRRENFKRNNMKREIKGNIETKIRREMENKIPLNSPMPFNDFLKSTLGLLLGFI